MAYQTITTADPTAGVVLTGHIRIALIGMHPSDAVRIECSEDDFATIELIDTVRHQSAYSGYLYEPRAAVKYRLAPENVPVDGAYQYVLAAG